MPECLTNASYHSRSPHRRHIHVVLEALLKDMLKAASGVSEELAWSAWQAYNVRITVLFQGLDVGR